MAAITPRLVLVVHNVRSAHNVGSLLRTAEGLAIDKVYLTGYTPYPMMPKDARPPHIGRKVSAAIAKTALGAEAMVDWKRYPDIRTCIDELERAGFQIAALEQTDKAIDLADFKVRASLALVVGNEVAGIDPPVLAHIRTHLRIPMKGSKESFNVSVAAAMALYHLSNLDKNSP